MKRPQLKWETKILILIAIVSFGFVGAISLFSRGGHQPHATSITTLIPAGQVLVPIEVENYEALDSILGPYGFVDLFSANGRHRQLLARNVKILRAPQNPSHFAVLVNENEAGALLKTSERFYVVVQGRPRDGMELVNKRIKTTSSTTRHRRIIYEGD